MSPQLNSPSSTHSSDSSLDSFKTAFSHLSPISTPEESDEETTKSDTADFMQQLQFITECKERFFKMEQQVNKLKQKLKEKDEELIAAQQQSTQKEDALKQRLAEKEQQLATQLPCPQHETESQLTELETMKTKLKLTENYLEEVEDEKKLLEEELFDVKNISQGEIHFLRQQLLDAKRQLFRCKQRIQELENTVSFFFETFASH